MTEAEKAYQYFVIAVPENEEQAKAYFWARKALQPTLAPPNEPLTLEQLREMDGEPVWVKQLKGLSVCDTDWAVVEFRLAPDVKHDKIRVWWPGSEDEDTPSEDDYGKTWLAYRRPPEGEV